ncbi:MAG: ABC transporter permease [Clostridia bacterium]|nr:ABC transporter permease [Clostridia bacterium]
MKLGRYVDHKYVRYTPVDALRRAGRFLRRFFAPSNVKHAFKNVISARREYAVFFIALIATQFIFWSSVTVFDSRDATARAEASSLADWTFAVEGYTQEQWFDIYNRELLVADAREEQYRGYVSYDAEAYTVMGEKLYSVKFTLPENNRADCDFIVLKYSLDKEGTSVRYSPAVDYEEGRLASKAFETVVIIVAGAISAFMLLALFLIRTNHYKFKYGVYMSFGADFEKLLETAGWELFAIAVITFLPAAILGIGVSALTIGLSGGAFALEWDRIPLAMLWTFIVVLVAVLPSVKILSVKAPINLLKAEDNSNLVSSPRRSKRMFGKKYPFHYELLSFLRFRRYYINLLASAVAFSTFFFLGNFLSDMMIKSANTPVPAYTISAGEGGLDAYDIEELAETQGIDYVLWENSVSAIGIGAHAVISRNQAADNYSNTVPAAYDESLRADNNFKFLSLDEFMISTAEKNGLWSVEGDPRSALNEPNTVVVSEYINNSRDLDFEVGDKIIIAVFAEQSGSIDTSRNDKKYILTQQLEAYDFAYLELTVGAVVDFADTDGEYTIGMSPAMFSDITGKSLGVSEAQIYLEPDLSPAEKQTAYAAVRRMAAICGGSVNDTYSDLYKAVDERCGYQNALRTCAVAIMLTAPLIWFFSQSAFAKKRRKENMMLSAFGADRAAMKKQYLASGVMLAIPACVLATALSTLVCYLVFVLFNEKLAAIGVISGVRFNFAISPLAYAVCAILNAVCAVVATYLPFRKYCREVDEAEKRSRTE